MATESSKGSGAGPGLARWILKSWMAILFFACFFIGGVFWLDTVRSAEQLLEVRGRPVEGLVLSKAIATTHRSGVGSRRSNQSTHYRVVYRFRADGADIVGTSEPGAGEWERLKERGPIAVVYAGGTPWIHRIEGDSAGWVAPLAFLLVGGLGMLGSGAAAFWFARRARNDA